MVNEEIRLQEFGRRLRALRQRSGLTATALAKATGLAQPTISNWECGRRYPATRYLERLAEVLGVDASVLAADCSDVSMYVDGEFALDDIQHAELARFFDGFARRHNLTVRRVRVALGADHHAAA